MTRNDPFINYNLPQTPPDWPIVKLHREQLLKFRSHYQELAEFAAAVCGVSVKELCMAHLMLYLMKQCDKEGKS